METQEKKKKVAMMLNVVYIFLPVGIYLMYSDDNGLRSIGYIVNGLNILLFFRIRVAKALYIHKDITLKNALLFAFTTKDKYLDYDE